MIELYLFDIEGTTTDVQFVHQVLFPYSYKAMESYVLRCQAHPTVRKALEDVRKTVWEEEKKQLSLEDVIAKLKEWIEQDRKHGALKELQGLIWEIGYANQEFQGHLYPDVKPFFEKIRAAKKQIGIYSSGSVQAQKLIFGFSTEGDLAPMISHFFDTKVGGKREVASYRKIAELTQLHPNQIRFFSDTPEELRAAKAAGFATTQVLRPGTAASEFESCRDFSTMV